MNDPTEMTVARPNLLDLDLADCEALVVALGYKAFHGRNLFKWIHKHGVLDYEGMTDVPKRLRADLDRTACLLLPRIIHARPSTDGTVKWVMALDDGQRIEMVHIPEDGRSTLCVSSQVGCALDCAFCATARQGFNRNLRVGEIVGQVWQATRQLGAPPTNVVMMGMGEPLANYENTLKSINILTCDFGLGISNRKITVSTCGLAPQIIQLGKDICINLAVSLNAPDDVIRNRLMPVNKKYPLKVLLEACRQYPMPGRRLLTFEYILINGVNSSVQDARKLAILLKGLRCKLNLIVFNEYPGTPFKSPQPEEVAAFQQVLLDRNFTTIVRKSKGSDILAACGQLSGTSGTY